MKISGKLIAAASGLLISCLLPALAQTEQSGNISIDGQVVMRIRVGAGGYTAAQRCESIQHRLIPILSLHHLVPSDVQVEEVNPNQSNIYVRSHLLVTVDETLAKSNGETPESLAEDWANNLRNTLPNASVKTNPRNSSTPHE